MTVPAAVRRSPLGARVGAIDATSRGAIAQSGERMAAAGIALVISVGAARRLDPAEFGSFSLVVSGVALLVPVCTLGLVGTLVDQLVRDGGRQTGWVARVTTMRLLAGVAIGAILAFAVGAGWLLADAWVLVVVPPLLALTTSFHAFEARSQLVRLAAVRAVGSAAALALLAVAWRWPSPGAFAAAFIAMYVVPGLIATALTIGRDRGHPRVAWRETRPLVRRSLPLIISSVGLVLNLRIDQLMIAWLDDVEAVGSYAIATNFSESLTFVAAAIAASHAAGLTRGFVGSGTDPTGGPLPSYDREVATMYRRLRRSGMATTAVSIAVGCAAIPVLYGSAYVGAIPILVIHAIGSFWYGLRQGVSRQLVVEHLIWLSVYSQVLAALINIVLNLVMIPWLSGVGAAISTLVSYFATGALIVLTPAGRHIGWQFLGLARPRRPTPLRQETP